MGQPGPCWERQGTAANAFGQYWPGEREGLSSWRYKAHGAQPFWGCSQGSSSFWGFFVLCPSDWCSVEVEDWNRRLKICEVFRAVKFLGLLACMRALVESSDLSRPFRAVRKQREQKGYVETTDLRLVIDFMFIICVKLTIRSLHWEPNPGFAWLPTQSSVQDTALWLTGWQQEIPRVLLCLLSSQPHEIWGGKTLTCLLSSKSS